MVHFLSKRVLSVGEAMLEFAPAGDGLYRQGYAGDTFNTIWHMAQLLGDGASAGFVTRIGTDTFSVRFAAEMASDGLDVVGVLRDPERQMGLYLIELDGVERSFHYWRKDSAARQLANDNQVLQRLFADAGLIHLSGITLAILEPEARENLVSSLADARRSGAVVSFDPNIRPRLWASQEEARATVSRMLAITDIALPSFDDEKALWGDTSPVETVKRMQARGVGEIAVKDGSNPVHYYFGGKDGNCDTPPVSRILDTTGAGDSFNAGYLAARLSGCTPRQSISAGQILSAEIIGNLGARAPKETVRRLSGVLVR